MRWLRWLFGWLFLLVMVAGLGWIGYVYYESSGEEHEFRLEKPTQGSLTVYLEATGTVQPEEVIDVGAQVAGKVEKFGTDPKDPNRRIDYGTRVEKGTILAELDSELFRSRLRLAESALLRAKADTRVLQAKLNQAEREWLRVQRVRGSSAIAEQEYDTARSAYEIGQAELLRGKAVEAETEAALTEAQANLNYTIIRSPVNGIIIDRRVNVGQTVVASLNAPSLFLIATDLTRMQIWVSVNEADIGQIRVGQTVTFTVDALPGERFEGSVGQVRLNARMEQNVVSYIVVVETTNTDLRLRPYLTANLKFLVHQRENSLLVPNAALRYKPVADRVDPQYRSVLEPPPAEKDRPSGAPPKGPPAAAGGEPGKAPPPRPEKKVPVFGTVWTQNEDGLLTPIKIRIGITDGKRTEVLEVLDGKLTTDTELVSGEKVTAKATSAVNPFAPPPMFGSKKTGSGSTGSGKK